MKNPPSQAYDCIVVGAGVAGCCTARELARFDLRICVLEAGCDLANGATRANSGIVHAGFDPEPGTLKAAYNVAGNALFDTWSEQLGFPFERIGSLVLAFDDEQVRAIHGLIERGRENGVEGIRYIEADELRAMEPNVSPEARGALYAPTGGICDPYGLALAAAENAAENGVGFRFDSRVTAIDRIAGAPGADDEYTDSYRVTLSDGTVMETRSVVNAAGIRSDELHNMVASHQIEVSAKRGEYVMLDTGWGTTFSHTMFQAPSAAGKGVLVSPTVHGNLLVGPSAIPQQDKDELDTTSEGLAGIMDAARRTWPDFERRGIIKNFCGLRSVGDGGDFVIGEPDDAPGFFDIACFDSPGLTSAPAVAFDISYGVAARLGARASIDFVPTHAAQKLFAHADDEERAAMIAADAGHGHIVCRCCEVTRADIVAAFHRPIPVLSLDALKWRCGAMMGRCNAGFCSPEIIRLFAAETGVEPRDIPKRFRGGNVVASNRPDYVELAKADDSAASVAAPFEEDTLYDVVVVGGGAAGIAAARSALRRGRERDDDLQVLLIDREARLGGILKQCVHNGFGLHRFNEELTGPEYAAREIAGLAAEGVRFACGSSVLSISPATDRSAPTTVTFVNASGLRRVRTRALVLATGSRERGIGAINTAGGRPAGVFSAGSAQNLINLQGCMPGKRAVILGSGDIGLIMARRLITQGAEVAGVYEIMPTPSGLRRNIVQCLDDYGIPLHLSTTVVRLIGRKRLEAVVVQQVDENLKPIAGTEQRIDCDTLLLSVGLLPENEVAAAAGVSIDPLTGGPTVDDYLETDVAGIFACGNTLHIHDLVDNASAEGDIAGMRAADFAYEQTWSFLFGNREGMHLGAQRITAGDGVRYTVPSFVARGHGRIGNEDGDLTISLRVDHAMEKPRFIVEGIDGNGGVRQLASSREVVAVPAEMVQLKVAYSELAYDRDRADIEEIRVRVEEGGAR